MKYLLIFVFILFSTLCFSEYETISNVMVASSNSCVSNGVIVICETNSVVYVGFIIGPDVLFMSSLIQTPDVDNFFDTHYAILKYNKMKGKTTVPVINLIYGVDFNTSFILYSDKTNSYLGIRPIINENGIYCFLLNDDQVKEFTFKLDLYESKMKEDKYKDSY
jgi:hypothetical protein